MTVLRHFALRVQDVEQTRRFYEKGLGLRFVDYRPGGVAMDLSDGNVNMTIIPHEGPAREALEEGIEFIHLGFLVDDLAAVYQRFIDIGAHVVREDVKERRIHDTSAPPQGSFKVLDPDGNVLDISERPEEWRV